MFYWYTFKLFKYLFCTCKTDVQITLRNVHKWQNLEILTWLELFISIRKENNITFFKLNVKLVATFVWQVLHNLTTSWQLMHYIYFDILHNILSGSYCSYNVIYKSKHAWLGLEEVEFCWGVRTLQCIIDGLLVIYHWRSILRHSISGNIWY